MSYDKESEIEGLRFCCGNSTRQSHYGYSYLSGYRAALLSLMDDMNSENSSISPQERLKLLDINTEKITNNGFGFGEWR